MPECFKKAFPDSVCPVIVDFTEVKYQKPGKVKQQNQMYSHYKSGHTIKFMIGIVPNGMITFLSETYSGRSSDTFITITSGFLSLLSPGDVVCADKGFPVITAKDVITIM